MGRTTMGRHSYGSVKVVGNSSHVYVGNFTSISEKVSVITLGHNIENVSTFPFNKVEGFPKAAGIKSHPVKYPATRIGSDVWIGYGVTIIGGNNIGHGAVIAAGTVIARDIEPYEVVAGNPCIHLKWRFAPRHIEALLKMQWWNWNDERINEEVPFMMTGKMIDEFIERNICK